MNMQISYKYMDRRGNIKTQFLHVDVADNALSQGLSMTNAVSKLVLENSAMVNRPLKLEVNFEEDSQVLGGIAHV